MLAGVSPEDLPTMQSVAQGFSYTDLLRLANLLLRDDETVNKAEHQRLAVEIALLKSATFPRLQSLEQVLAGDPKAGRGSSPAPNVGRGFSPPTPGEGRAKAAPSVPPTPATGDLVEAIKKKKPMVASYLKDAALSKEGSRVIFELDDAFAVDSINDARGAIEEIASQHYGERVSVEARLKEAEPAPAGRRAEDKPAPLRDDPVLSAFRKHLGGEIVKERER
jgi:hypothetical protein